MKKVLIYNKTVERKILQCFNVGKDFKIVFKKIGKYAGLYFSKPSHRIYIDNTLSDTNKIITLVHELIHWKWKLNHDDVGHYCGFYSNKHDHLSEIIASIVFKRKMVWED